MKKGKGQKSKARRRGSASQHASSEGTGSSPQPPSPPPTRPPPSTPTTPPPSSGVTSQPSSESIPPQPVPQALPAPEVSRWARGVASPDTGTKASPRSSKTGGQPACLSGSSLPADGVPGLPQRLTLFFLGTDAWLTRVLERCVGSARGLGFVFLPRRPGFLGFVIPHHTESL